MVKKSVLTVLLVLAVAALIAPEKAEAQQLPKVSISVDSAEKPRDVALALEILFLFTILTLAPSIMIMMTAFTRIVIVLYFIKQALSLQQMPPSQMIIGLALFLTFFVMRPVVDEIYTDAYQPYVAEEISSRQAMENGIKPVRDFMLRQTREKDLALFIKLSKTDRPATVEDIPNHVLIPSFIISEMRRGFQIGFLLYIPFLMIDMIVASILMSMGMLMLPPMMISLPFKLLLFVLIDGWTLLIGSMIEGFS